MSARTPEPRLTRPSAGVLLALLASVCLLVQQFRLPLHLALHEHCFAQGGSHGHVGEHSHHNDGQAHGHGHAHAHTHGHAHDHARAGGERRVHEHGGFLQTFYTGAGIPHFTGKSLAKVPIPVPPLAEQQRIVAKVDELMTLLDRLAEKLTSMKASHGAFAAAAVHQLDA